MTQRAIGRIVHWQKGHTYNEAFKNLKLGIKRSKRKCFKEFYSKANINRLGSAYWIAMGRLRVGSSPQIRCLTLSLIIIQKLFSQQKRGANSVKSAKTVKMMAIPTVATNEVLYICGRNTKLLSLKEYRLGSLSSP